MANYMGSQPQFSLLSDPQFQSYYGTKENPTNQFTPIESDPLISQSTASAAARGARMVDFLEL